MLEKYKSIIYENKEVEEKVKDTCINCIVVEHKDYTREEIMNQIASREPNDLQADFSFYLLMEEGKLLFDKAVKKFGNTLWSGEAWRISDCKRKCPFGDMCRKYLVEIDNIKYCFGQLYHNHNEIRENKLVKIIIKMADKYAIKILKTDGNALVDLKSPNFDVQILSGFFSNYEWFVWWFGDNGGKGKVNGCNVIPFL